MNIKKNEGLHFAIFILLPIFWSGSFINIKIVVDALPPIFCALVRVIISFICLSILYVFMNNKAFKFSLSYWRLWVAGLFTQAFPFALLFYGEKFIAPAFASIINSTVSIWSLLLGALIFRDFSQWTPIKIIGFVSGFGGIVLIFLPFIHGSENSLIGIFAITGMAICYAIGGLINQHIIFKTMTVSFETNLIQQHLASIIFLTAISLSLESWPSLSSLLNIKVLLAFLYLGIVATAIAWTMFFYLIKVWGAVRTTSVLYIVPVLAIIWDFLFLHIYPTTNELIGMLTILIGVTLTQWKRNPGKDYNSRQSLSDEKT
jgi:drug/metabolite transporter (DMT)-like permease